MTYTEEVVYIGHEAAEKDKTSYDLYRRSCVYRSYGAMEKIKRRMTYMEEFA